MNIEDENKFNFNFFLTHSNIKHLSKTIQKIIQSDIILLFFNLVDSENPLFFDFLNPDIEKDSPKSKKETKNNATHIENYKSIIQPIFEILHYLNMEKRIIILLNKIDHP